MLVLEAWILTFSESLVENVRFGGLDRIKVSRKILVLEASLVVSTKSVQQQCFDKSVKQECQARVSSKSVQKKSVKQECLAGVSCKSVLQVSKQECLAGVSCQACQKCPAGVSNKCPARVPGRVSSKGV